MGYCRTRRNVFLGHYLLVLQPYLGRYLVVCEVAGGWL